MFRTGPRAIRAFRFLLLACLAMSLLTTKANAAPQVSPAATLATQSDVQGLVSSTGANINDMAIIGSYGYVARTHSITILDLQNPDALRPIANVVWPRGAQRLVANGNLLLNITDDRHLQIIDATQPTQLAVRSEQELPTYTYYLASTGGFVYLDLVSNVVRDGRWVQSCAMQVVDISNPDQPRLRGQVDMMCPTSFRAVGTMVYVMRRNESSGDEVGLQLIDASNPDAPRLRGNYPGSLIFDVRVVGNIAYLMYVYHLQASTIDAIDIRDPDHLQRVGRVTFATEIGSMYVNQQTLGVLGQTGLSIFSISNPAQPVLKATFPQFTNALFTRVVNGVVYGFMGDKVEAIDLSQPFLPRIRSSWSEYLGFGGVCVDGDYAYNFANTILHTGSLHALQVIDIHNRALPAITSSISFVDKSGGLGTQACGNGVLALEMSMQQPDGSYTSELDLYNTSDPAHPALASMYPLPPGAREIVLYKGYAYVLVHPLNPDSNLFLGLLVIDIRNPAAPVERQRIPGVSYSIPVFGGNRAYWPTLDQQMLVLDVSDPGTPQKLGGFIVDGEVFHADGNIIYVQGKELQVIDASDVTWPKWLGTLPLPWTINRTVVGTTVYLAIGDGTLFVVDAAKPDAMRITNSYVIPKESTVSADQSYAYLYSQTEGLWIYNTAPSAATQQGLARLNVAVGDAPQPTTRATLASGVSPNAWLTITTYNANGDVIPYVGRLYLIDPEQKAVLQSSVELTAADQGKKAIPFHMPQNAQLNLLALDAQTGVGTRFTVQTRAYTVMVPLVKR